MKYQKDDIRLDQISHVAFESLCYDLLIKYNFQNVIWRQGGADNGRDIEASYTFNNMIRKRETKWFFECKHYTSGGVPPEHLYSKIAWADAEMPSALVIFISSYLSNNARVWIEKMVSLKSYEIICIEGEEFKERLLSYPDLIERYFSLNRYDQLLKDIKDYKVNFNVNPSFELLKEVIDNVDLKKLDTEDFGFILLNFFGQYGYFETRNEYYGDFEPEIVDRLLKYLKASVTNETLVSFREYKDDYDELASAGIFDEMHWLDDQDDIHTMKEYKFQYYELHLNHNQSQENWKIGLYLFVIYDSVAFEIFKADRTEIRIIKDFTPERIDLLSPRLKKDIVPDYRRYLLHFSP